MPLVEPLRRRLALQDALLTRQAERSLRAYLEQAWPILEPTTPFLGNWHIDLIAEHLEAVTAGDITRLLINVPPRYMKSLLVSGTLADLGVDPAPESTLDRDEL